MAINMILLMFHSWELDLFKNKKEKIICEYSEFPLKVMIS